MIQTRTAARFLRRIGRRGAIVVAGAGAAACQRAPGAGRIDQILAGATVITLDSTATGPAPTALALGGGRVLALGNADSVARWRRSGAPVLDLTGKFIAPAFVDHHVHLYNVGLALLNAQAGQRLFLDLSDVSSLSDLEGRVAARAASTPDGGWVVGAGWSQAAWGAQSLPNADVLSRASSSHPVFLSRVDGHAGWVNERALTLAGITSQTADPAGGRIERRAGRVPSGVLLERANELLVSRIDGPTDADVVAAFRSAADSLAARGVVQVYDAGALAYPGVVALDADFGRMLRLLCRADSIAPLPLDVNLMIPAPSRLADSLLALASPIQPLSPRVRITHLKLFVDGAFGSRGAALTHRYADDSGTAGVARMTAAEIATLTRRGLDKGLGIAAHAIGDEAVARVLDGYQTVLRERPELDPSRLRIEHFSYARDADFARAVRLGVILSIQSNFNAAASETPTLGDRRVGPDAESRVYAWDRLFQMGAKLAEGSDYFTRPAGPMAGFVATLTRKYSVGERRADPAARLLAWRLNSTWFPAVGPRVDPTIRPGSAANLVVLSSNPLEGPRADLAAIGVLATIRGGRIVAAAPSLGAR